MKKCYKDDQNSRMLPGANDFVSCKQQDGTRIHCQKRLVLCNLKEFYARFEETHPDCKIGFSKFAELRPRYCVLAGTGGTHSLCVCLYHENPSLMFDGSNVVKLLQNSAIPLSSVRDCLRYITCKQPSLLCYSDNDKERCDECPKTEELAKYLTKLFDDDEVNLIKFRVWRYIDRTELKTEELDCDQFLENFCTQFEKLKIHDFVARKQSEFIKKKKETLTEGEIMIQCDFAENYNFIAQNAVQSYYYNNDSATLYTVVVYYRSEGELQHKSIVIISDNHAHDSVAVHVYTKIIIKYLQEEAAFLTKILYVTDGGPGHFKNRYTFINLMHHSIDFGIPAEWHFSATSHGKSACDGVGGI